ncbi:hypothetical protein [Haloarchaeobius sp. TZWWS8]|uniref:hypothetical protein n=1 Tax=Haloarchaeobius sp. TZWWS8 TaxID=3446121 RepID=UPI003EB96AB1
MVEVSIEVLAGIAVTIFLMLLFLGVVVAWDIALALRDVAERIDSLEDDVDEDLGTIDMTLTRIHDRLGGLAQGAAASSDATHGDPAGAGAVASSQPSPSAAAGANAVGVGRPGGSTGAGVGQFQQTGQAAAPSAAAPSVDERGDKVDTTNATELGDDAVDTTGADESGTDDEQDGEDVAPDDATDDEGSDDLDDGDGENDGDADEVDEADDLDDADNADEADGADNPAQDADDEDIRDDEDVRDGSEDADDGSEDADDDSEDADDGSEDADDGEEGEGGDGNDGEESPDDDSESGMQDPIALEASAAEYSQDVDEEAVAEALGVDVAKLDDLEPETSTAELVQNFGREARTNRGLASPGGVEAMGFDDEFEYVDAVVEDVETRTIEDLEATATDEDTGTAAASGANLGRFATEDEAWYEVDFDGRVAGATDAARDRADATRDRATDAARDGETDDVEGEAGDSGGIEDAVEKSDMDAAAESDAVTDAADAEIVDSPEDDGTAQQSPEQPDTSDDDAEQPGRIVDVVDQQLTSLAEEAGGSSLGPDVSDMVLTQAVSELDGSSFRFPLSSRTWNLSAAVDGGAASLRLSPEESVTFDAARKQLLRYQLRNYLDKDRMTHADIEVDDSDVVLEVPAATGESLDAWADALVQIVDRTFYLTGDD